MPCPDAHDLVAAGVGERRLSGLVGGTLGDDDAVLPGAGLVTVMLPPELAWSPPLLIT
jgi:hypothetical protein